MPHREETAGWITITGNGGSACCVHCKPVSHSLCPLVSPAISPPDESPTVSQDLQIVVHSGGVIANEGQGSSTDSHAELPGVSEPKKPKDFFLKTQGLRQRQASCARGDYFLPEC